MNKYFIIGIVVIGAIAVFFFLRPEAEVPEQDTTPVVSEAAILVVDHESTTDEVMVQATSFTKPGYIVIHLSVDGKPGAVIGQSDLYQPGTYSDVVVAVSTLTEGPNALFAMLHDDDGDSVYEFPGDDVPTTLDGSVVIKPFTATKMAQ